MSDRTKDLKLCTCTTDAEIGLCQTPCNRDAPVATPSSKTMSPNLRATHVRWLTIMLEHYSGEEKILSARLDEGEVWGDGHENEWRRYQAESAALRAAIEALSASTPVETSGPIAVADAFEEVLRVEIASDTPEKVEKFRVALCDLIFDAPAAGNHDVMVTIHKGDSIPAFETNRSPVGPRETACRYEAAIGAVCNKCWRIHDFGPKRCAECQTPRLCGVERECLRNRYVRPAVEPTPPHPGPSIAKAFANSPRRVSEKAEQPLSSARSTARDRDRWFDGKPEKASGDPAVLDRRVTVCDKCLCACCWHGEFMCDDARNAGTVDKTIRELLASGAPRESNEYWFKSPNSGKIDQAGLHSLRAYLAARTQVNGDAPP